MKIRNHHERAVAAPPEQIAALIADFGRVWPTQIAPAPQRRRHRLYDAGLMFWEEFDRPGAARAGPGAARAAAGIETDGHGHVVTDDTYQTSVPGIWALGDLANHLQLKHMANAETRLVRHNLLHPRQPRRAAFTVVPSAVFAGPQVASVGATEQDLRADCRDYVAAIRPCCDTAYGWALEDTTSFVKVLADPATCTPPAASAIKAAVTSSQQTFRAAAVSKSCPYRRAALSRQTGSAAPRVGALAAGAAGELGLAGAG